MIIKTKSFELAVNSRGNPSSTKLAIVLPGRLDTKDYGCFNSHLEMLSNNGFFAISFDPPGTWESPGGIGLFTTTNYIQAVNELIKHFGSKPTILIGHSRGGAIANIVGTKNPLVTSIITINASFGPPSPPSEVDVKKGVHIGYRDLPPGDSKTAEQKKFEVPLSYFKDGDKYNDAEELKNCFKPKLIFHGIDDEYNSSEDVKKVFDSIPQPKVLIELKCNHDYRYYPEIVEEVNKEIKKFFSKLI